MRIEDFSQSWLMCDQCGETAVNKKIPVAPFCPVHQTADHLRVFVPFDELAALLAVVENDQ